MTAISVCTAPPGSEEWLAERRNGIGASDVATLLGHNPFGARTELWLELTGKSDGFTGNYMSKRGHHLEPFILSAWSEQHPGYIVETAPDDIPSIMAHPDIPEARCSLDALAHSRDETAVIEIKSGGHRQIGNWADGSMPDAYALQVQAQLAITGLDVAYVAADIGGEYLERVVPANAAVGTHILDSIYEFWTQNIIGGAMPEPDPVRDRDILARLWTPDVTLEPVVLPSDLIERLREAKAAVNAAKTDYEIAAAEVQVALGEAVAGVDANGDPVCSWTATKARTTVDTARLKADGIYDQYSMTGQPGRSFRVKL